MRRCRHAFSFSLGADDVQLRMIDLLYFWLQPASRPRKPPQFRSVPRNSNPNVVWEAQFDVPREQSILSQKRVRISTLECYTSLPMVSLPYWSPLSTKGVTSFLSRGSRCVRLSTVTRRPLCQSTDATLILMRSRPDGNPAIFKGCMNRPLIATEDPGSFGPFPRKLNPLNEDLTRKMVGVYVFHELNHHHSNSNFFLLQILFQYPRQCCLDAL